MTLKNWITGALFSLMSSQLIAAPIVYFDFDGDGIQDTTSSATLGSSITAGLYVSNVDSLNGGLVSWGTEINFTNSLLSASSFTITPSWPLAGVGNNIDNSTGTIELLASSFSAQTGTIKLADISFDTLSTGAASITLDQLFPGLATFSGFTAADGTDYDSAIDFSLATSTINISAIPLPSSLILFISGIFGLLKLGKFRE